MAWRVSTNIRSVAAAVHISEAKGFLCKLVSNVPKLLFVAPIKGDDPSHKTETGTMRVAC